jgi:tetratricopeptide (TPR) repeat protein
MAYCSRENAEIQGKEFADNKMMIQMLFFLRFKSQLRRTRPELISQIDNALSRAVAVAGGKITAAPAVRERWLLSASFNGDSPGFWLDMLMLIETVVKRVETASSDLYGYSLVFGRELSESSEGLCRFLANGNVGGGVFLDRAAVQGLLPYAEIEKSGAWLAAGRTPHKARTIKAGNFCRLKEFKVFSRPRKQSSSLQETVVRALNQGAAERRRNVLVIGPGFSGKRNGVYRYCADLGDMPLLSLRFGSGGINAFVDSCTPIREPAAEHPAQLPAEHPAKLPAAEINSLWETLFRERLRDELSPFVMRKARRFFTLVLERHIASARTKGRVPVLVLEDVHLAGETETELFIDVYGGLKNTGGLLILGTCSEASSTPCDEKAGDEAIRKWERIFQRVIRLNAEGISRPAVPELPAELWETAYALSLFSRYYPAVFFEQLCEEEGKNPAMITRALAMLETLGVIDSSRRFCIDRIDERAKAALGANADRIQAMTRRRLLDWTAGQKINPCFRLLVILFELGGKAELTDQLILTSIISDLANGTASSIERAGVHSAELSRNTGLLEKLAGQERAAAVRFIFETTRALLSGGEDTIRAAFKNPPPDCSAFPVLQAQIQANLAAFNLGQRDHSAALETVKEAIMLSQGTSSGASRKKDQLCLPQSYRLFSLASLSKQQTGESIDYLGFAVENAEKSGNHHELGVSAYYAAATQFLFGNISRAAQLARKGREQALAAGCGDWADRSRFLEGRLAFEIGSYREALEIFETLRREPFDGNTAEKDRLLAAWAYRAKVYFQNPLTPKPESGGSDADLFEVEAAFLAGNYRKAVELTGGGGANLRTKENFLYTEQPDWRSGFAQCELLYFSRSEFWERMTCAYRSLSLCRLSVSGGEEAIHNMQRILRNEQLSEMDPWDAFYFYAWYRILDQTGAGQVDMNTAVSMAFKRLQRRASRIDDIETRRQYLNQPRWNSALSAAAKEYKLI